MEQTPSAAPSLWQQIEHRIAAGDRQAIHLVDVLTEVLEVGQLAGVKEFALEYGNTFYRVLDEHGCNLVTLTIVEGGLDADFGSAQLATIARGLPNRIGSFPNEICPHCGEVHFPLAPAPEPAALDPHLLKL